MDEPTPTNGKSAGQIAAYRSRIALFIAAVEDGASDRAAASVAGLGRATVHRWMTGERRWDEAMRSRVMRARAIRERRLMALVEAAAQPTIQMTRNGRAVTAPGDWRAAAWLLERTNPEYAPRGRVEYTGADGGPLAIEASVEHRLARPDEGRLRRVMELLNAAGVLFPQLEDGKPDE
jgi:transposase